MRPGDKNNKVGNTNDNDGAYQGNGRGNQRKDFGRALDCEKYTGNHHGKGQKEGRDK